MPKVLPKIKYLHILGGEIDSEGVTLRNSIEGNIFKDLNKR